MQRAYRGIQPRTHADTSDPADVAFNSPFRVIAFHSAQYAHAIAPYAASRRKALRFSALRALRMRQRD